ncbi:MAG: T9SS type A sorting domain-containing protein [Chitinophagaceae bacterium]|nr:T9SS type A sorting domain-containing protein [Chitinophagaceae bacterium]
MKKSYLLLFFVLGSLQIQAQAPSTAATTPPTRNSTDVISLYSQAYTNVAGTDWNPGWGQSTQVSNFNIGSDTMIKYTNLNYQGVQFASGVNASNMTKLHLDIWTNNCTSFEVFFVNTSPSPSVEQNFVITPTLNGWNSIDIDLSNYTNIALHNIGQFKFVGIPFGSSTVYIDNIYFWKSPATPTITGFTIPNKNMGNPKFKITPPTSNSLGAFSYTSSNTGVATVNGDSITLVGVGHTYIKATQAPDSTYTAGTISTTLNVASGLPTTPTNAAPTPSRPAANVISKYSNAYTNGGVDTWSAPWDQADVADVQVQGNDTKLYTNLVFAGIEFVGANMVNATNAQFFHIDIWTPNATNFKVKLVDFGANGAYGGGDDSEHEYTCTPPAFSTWVSYDIPMADFTGLAAKAHLAQLLLISSGSTVYVDNVFFWSNSPLPITLSSFTASKEGSTAKLNWITSFENNNKGFDVQKSNDGKNWETIDYVAGVGFSTTESTYTSTDESPFKGTNFYRLKQMDLDGKTSYSNIVSVRFADRETVGLSFFPNPTKDKVVILIDEIQNKNASIDFINLQGKVIKTIAITEQQSNSNLIVDVSNFSRGLYIVKLNNGSVVKTNKLIIN